MILRYISSAQFFIAQIYALKMGLLVCAGRA